MKYVKVLFNMLEETKQGRNHTTALKESCQERRSLSSFSIGVAQPPLSLTLKQTGTNKKKLSGITVLQYIKPDKDIKAGLILLLH